MTNEYTGIGCTVRTLADRAMVRSVWGIGKVTEIRHKIPFQLTSFDLLYDFAGHVSVCPHFVVQNVCYHEQHNILRGRGRKNAEKRRDLATDSVGWLAKAE